jgi:uncharacterized phage-like protein YoqJ
MDKSLTCCFTGHRPEKMPFNTSKYSYDAFEFRQNLERAVQSAILSGYRHFISGMSRGMDLWAAMSVLDFKRAYPGLTLEAAIPCPGQCSRWGADDQKFYRMILSRCDTQTTLSPSYTPGCMDRRNRYMVDNSSLLIAAFDGTPGGTYNTCRYARQRGVRIYNILAEKNEYAGSLV